MTSLDGVQTPKTRQMPPNKTALVAALDIGTSKIACLIARLKPCPPSDALRGRTHAVELIGLSHIQSRGIKAGAVVDLNECEQAVRHAVALAERMAQGSRRIGAAVGVGRPPAGQSDRGVVGYCAAARSRRPTSSRVISAGMHHATRAGRTVLHALPVGYSLDGVKGVRDPRGMVARHFGDRHECRHRRCDGRKKSDAGGRALPSQRRGDGGRALCRRACRC